MVHTIVDVLENIVDGNKATDMRILNMDETLRTDVQRREKVIPQTGKHQIGAISSCDRGKNGALPGTVSCW
jgi:hypothetical protein